MIVVDSHGKAAAGRMKILPGESCPLPLEAAYEKRFRLRPLREYPVFVSRVRADPSRRVWL